MDIETVKTIAETVKTLGIEGKGAFLWWIAADFAKTLVTGGATTAVVIVAIKAVLIACRSDAEMAMLTLRGMLGVGCPGALSDREVREIVAEVAKLIEKSKK